MLGSSSMARLELALGSCSVKGILQSDKKENTDWLPLNYMVIGFEA